MGLDKLNHIKETKENVKVYILDKGEIIDSEAEAMLQALHSRSTGGFENHLKILEEKGAENFMSKFYVGYGHKSIGDCGSITIFIEGISMLAAKAIQDSKLYNGQESSTRYIDFSKQKFINSIENEIGENILEKQREFYLSILEPVKNYLKELFPIDDGENYKIYEKAIDAKTFDIARGFLPCGASTNLAWHSNLRQISDRLLFLRHHPLKEVRDIAETIERAVLKKAPNSFSTKRYENTEKYQDLIGKYYYYHNKEQKNLTYDLSKFDFDKLNEYKELINNRPEKTELPSFLNNLGEMEFSFLLDFGSFRDLQRHRAINQRMPLVTTELGFNSFYIESLPKDIQIKARKHLEEIKKEIKSLDLSKEEKQYYIPMGYNTSNHFTGTLPAIVYMVELRATRFVHPTLRKIAYNIGKVLEDKGIKLNLDKEKDKFDIKRGEHDIKVN
jgi:thymidylate synthase ThyX